MSEDPVREALVRRALGYETDEVVEEYGFNEGEAVLLKRKVTKKERAARHSGGKDAAGRGSAAGTAQ